MQPHPCVPAEAVPCPHLHIASIEVHPADHAALGCHIGPVDHLLSVVKVQGDGIVQALRLGVGMTDDCRVKTCMAGGQWGGDLGPSVEGQGVALGEGEGGSCGLRGRAGEEGRA